MKPDKVLSYIGLSAKSGKIASGEFSTEKAVKEGKAKLVIVAEDSSDNTKKMFTNMKIKEILILKKKIEDYLVENLDWEE